MATYTVIPNVPPFFSDADGNPAALYQLFTYEAGSTTKLATYNGANSATASANTNPIILDASGWATIFLPPGLSYKFVLATPTDTDPPATPVWTRDGIQSVPTTTINVDIPGTAGQDLVANDSVYLADGTGGTTAGRWYKTDADDTFASTLAKKLGFATADIATGVAGSIRETGQVTGLAGLTAGTVYYASATAGSITSSAPANARIVGVADSTTTLLIPGPIPDASATIAGLVTTGSQTWSGTKTLSAQVAFTGLPTGIGSFVTSYATGNTTKNNNTTLVNVTGLSFAVAANQTYEFTFIIHFVTSTVAGLKVTLTGPAAPTGLRYGIPSNGAQSGSPNSLAAFASTMVVFPSGSASGSDMCLAVSGQLRNGANAGTVQFQFAQSTGEVSDTIVYAESSLMAWRVA